MRLKQEDLLDRHKGKPAVVFGHGPSLSTALPIIKDMQEQQDMILFTLNDWYKLFDIGKKSPDYWVFANSDATIHAHQASILQHNSTVLFSDTVDTVISYDELDTNFKNLNYFPYDQRHFKGHSCTQIWHNFYQHYFREQNNNFTEYGNNAVMWEPEHPDRGNAPAIRWFNPNKITPYTYNRCCQRIKSIKALNKDLMTFINCGNTKFKHQITNWEPGENSRLTIQEELQRKTNYHEHYSPGDTVILHAISFAVIMGCNPIYVAGMDLDYSVGYVNNNPSPSDDGWQKQQRNLINDIRIINESAKNINVDIINIKADPWYGQFESFYDINKNK